ncbi:MAG: LysM peptidoglycan-binding domain-containing protein, partial [Rhodospirillales bacterium]|nr:LysM peptidoglycan-binding domain-containing protein [Rhodospirillales bacterium]
MTSLPPLEDALPQPRGAKSQAPTPANSRDVVLVRPQETLYTIARRHGVSLRDLIDANRLSPPYAISPGQRLVLPRARFHRVTEG